MECIYIYICTYMNTYIYVQTIWHINLLIYLNLFDFCLPLLPFFFRIVFYRYLNLNYFFLYSKKDIENRNSIKVRLEIFVLVDRIFLYLILNFLFTNFIQFNLLFNYHLHFFFTQFLGILNQQIIHVIRFIINNIHQTL